ncbi:hypothetical protein H4582DRAFT_2089147 [Lactarius indigo]|nr:hypothetical protein H4582DRAFT_2089147 [Lactarius indigo]
MSRCVSLAWLKTAQLGWLSRFEPSHGNTIEDSQEDPTPLAPENAADLDEDGAPIEGVSETLSIVTLSEKTENAYLQNLIVLAEFIQQPDLLLAIQKFIFSTDNPSLAALASLPGTILGLPQFQAQV